MLQHAERPGEQDIREAAVVRHARAVLHEVRVELGRDAHHRSAAHERYRVQQERWVVLF